ncbi:MAG: type II toxin-antitoxin system RelE/ParE family toxin [Planctomycetota bacterium]
MAKIVWSEAALDWMQRIDAFLAERSPAAAVKTLEGIIERVEMLGKNPRSGGMLPEKLPRDVRMTLYGNYRIIYEVYGDEEVRILVVVHAAMDLSRIEL